MSVKLKEVEFHEAIVGPGKGNSVRWENVPRLNKGGADITWDGPVVVLRGLPGSKAVDEEPTIVPLSYVKKMVPEKGAYGAPGKKK